jgi:multidrug efflux pump subunit AcrA (membrane-fusion protein)
MADSGQNTLAIADILLLQQQLRNKVSLRELGYFLVNDTQKITPYQMGIFYRSFRGSKKIEAVSGIPAPVKEAPFYIWAIALCKAINAKQYAEPTQLNRVDFATVLTAQWDEFLPPQVLWLPLISADGEALGGLLLARLPAWRMEELRLLQYWSGAVAHSVELLSHKKHSLFAAFKQVKTVVWIAIAVALLLVAFIPVSISVLAPAEVVPKNPLVVRAPLEGVIDKVYAQPNKTVAKEALLLTLDDTPLKSRLDVAQQELEIAKAEYRRSEQASVLDAKAATEMPMLAARIAQREAEVAYINTLLKRIIIRANHAGIAIIHDAYELEGKPVKLGERLLTIAQPQQAELEMWLAVGDSIDLPDAAEVKLFLNVTPETPYPAILRYVNFQAEMSPEGLFAFRVRADFPDPQQLPRVGLRGTAKIYGKQVPLYYYVFRRPYAAARQWLGL